VKSSGSTPASVRASLAARMPRVALRFTVAWLVLVVALAPLMIVLGWLRVEQKMEAQMLRNASFSAREAARLVSSDVEPVAVGPRTGTYSTATPPATAAPLAIPEASSAAPVRAPDGKALRALRLEGVARVHQVRLRVFDASGEELENFDFDYGRDLSQRAGGVVLRSNAERAGRAFDESFGAVAARAEFLEALRSTPSNPARLVEGCRDIPERDLVVCHAVARVLDSVGAARVIYVQDSSERPLAALYELGFQLKRLTLVVLPLALVLSWVAGRRVVRPLEALRDQVLAKVREPRPKPDLVARANDETRDLADAFNTLLERLNARRAENETFVADLVHEFKNPVATIRACADTLGSTPVEPERAERIARLLRESSGRLDLLVTEFLELARAEAGMLRESWGSVDLAALARGKITSMSDDERWASTRFELNAPELARVRGVPLRLESALTNLLENAASFAGAAGKVTVTISVVDGQVTLAVSDDGPGIAPEDLSHVFERFFTTRRHDRGTGLGLALVRAIVEGHGGAVKVHSQPGHGATFTATFPRPSIDGRNS
jgi:two-component system sensor histidine kinase ChvG